jgi:hypothetical protein
MSKVGGRGVKICRLAAQTTLSYAVRMSFNISPELKRLVPGAQISSLLSAKVKGGYRFTGKILL